MLRKTLSSFRFARILQRDPFSTSAQFPNYEYQDMEIALDEIRTIQSQPIIKSIFKGRINSIMFEFPEWETNEQLNSIQIKCNEVNKFMAEDVDSTSIDQKGSIPEKTIQAMKRLGLFGLQIPQEYGGSDLTPLQRACVSEYLGLDGGISHVLVAHESIAVQAILDAGTDEQKKRYLPKLATGNSVAAYCLTEAESGSDIQSIEARACLSEDGSHYILDGTKIWVMNGDIADVYIVFAKTKITQDDGGTTDRLTAFIVDREFGGVSHGPRDTKMGNRGCGTCMVTFNNTRVPLTNVLGKVGEGFKLAVHTLDRNSFLVGAHGIGIVKYFLNEAIRHALNNNESGVPIKESQLVQEKISEIASQLYAMESMVYLAASLVDRFEKEDFSLESAVVKVFCSETIWNCVNDCLQILGNDALTNGHPYERLFRDIRSLSIHHGTNEVLRIFISGTSLKYVANSISKDIKKIGNPERYPMFNAKRVFQFVNVRDKSIDRHLQFNVHLSLAPIMDRLSYQINCFQFIISQILGELGRDIIEEQLILETLADSAIDIFAICASVSRASQCLSLDLESADHEYDLTYAFSKAALNRIDMRNKNLVSGDVHTGIPERSRIADVIMKFGGYCASHPLTRNW